MDVKLDLNRTFTSVLHKFLDAFLTKDGHTTAWQLSDVAWYKKAANKGNVIAQFNLAKMYKNGVGVNKDYDKAFEIFEQIAE